MHLDQPMIPMYRRAAPFGVPGVSAISKANTFYEITNMILKLASEVGPQEKV